jgi:ATP/ADP translocase
LTNGGLSPIIYYKMNTDLTVLFKTVTESVPNYLMFIILIVMCYGMCVSFVKIVCDNVVKVVLANRVPVTFKVKDGEITENN